FPTFQVAAHRRRIARHGLAFRVLPEDAHRGTATRHGDVINLSDTGEAIMLPAGHRESSLPIAVQAFPVVGADIEATLRPWATLGIVGKVRSDFVARRRCVPAGGKLVPVCRISAASCSVGLTGGPQSFGSRGKTSKNCQNAQTQPPANACGSTVH